MLPWFVMAAGPALAQETSITLAGVRITVPEISGRCVIGPDHAARDFFERSRRFLARSGNDLKAIIIACREQSVLDTPGQGYLSQWTYVYAPSEGLSVLRGGVPDHATFSRHYCAEAKGYSKPAVLPPKARPGSVPGAKPPMNKALPERFDAPFMYLGSCFLPVRSRAARPVYGLLTPVAVKGRAFLLATYARRKGYVTSMPGLLLAISGRIRVANR